MRLWSIDQAKMRGYALEIGKIKNGRAAQPIPMHPGQLLHEWEYLKVRLSIRDPQRYKEMSGIAIPETHPLFGVVDGAVEEGERR